MNKCVDDLRNWMITDILMINDDKTEVLLIGARQQLAKINTACSITFGEYDIDPSLCETNLGVWFDSHLSMSKYLSRDSLLALIHALVAWTSVMVFCMVCPSHRLSNYNVFRMQQRDSL